MDSQIKNLDLQPPADGGPSGDLLEERRGAHVLLHARHPVVRSRASPDQSPRRMVHSTLT
jgi:hypothetical protein